MNKLSAVVTFESVIPNARIDADAERARIEFLKADNARMRALLDKRAQASDPQAYAERLMQQMRKGLCG